MKTPRMCSRFYCDARGDRYCCRDCPRIWSCDNPCYNDPSRCRLEDTGQRRIFASEVAKVKGQEE